jgi:hypothetical protein
MKNAVKLLGIIAMTAIIGLGFTACGDMDESAQSTKGRLTITGLSSYNGWTMDASGSDSVNEADRLICSEKNKPESGANDVSITADSITLYVWKPWIRKGKSDLRKSYSGNDQNRIFDVSLDKGDGQNSASGTVTVNFTKGVGTGAFVANP